jgi:UDP-3-O-[3-hydroxymyristoyl] glucosamine N-acyltransferase
MCIRDRYIHIGAYAIIDENATIGNNTEILSGAYIGRNVKVGNNCILLSAGWSSAFFRILPLEKF